MEEVERKKISGCMYICTICSGLHKLRNLSSQSLMNKHDNLN
jgi:hypothetical protein